VSVNCGAKVMAANTTISTICGCAASSNIPISMPNSDTVSMECLASAYNTTLHDHYEFACPVDSNGNPMQSCLNSLGFFCGRNHTNGRPNRIQGCKSAVDDNFSTMSSFWIALRRECGQWAWTDGYIGNATSSSCIAAKVALQQIQNANCRIQSKFIALMRLSLFFLTRKLLVNPKSRHHPPPASINCNCSER